MHQEELSALLDGGDGATLTLSSPEGPVRVYLTRHDLRTPVAWRAAMRRALGDTGYEPPVYSQEDHDQLVRVLFRFAGAVAATRQTQRETIAAAVTPQQAEGR